MNKLNGKMVLLYLVISFSFKNESFLHIVCETEDRLTVPSLTILFLL